MDHLSVGALLMNLSVSFVLVLTKYLKKDNLGKEGAALTHSLGGTVRGVWESVGTGGHMVSSVRMRIANGIYQM